MTFNLQKIQKKGAMGAGIDKAMSVTLLLVFVGALAPTMFGTNWSAITGAPTFVTTLVPLLIGFVLIYIIYKQAK